MMERKIGYTEMGRRSWAQLGWDLAELQHEIWRKKYGQTNPKCNVPFSQLPKEEQRKNEESVRAILGELVDAGYLQF